MDNKRRINVRALVARGDKILAVKHRESDGTESLHWALPGGGLDPLETLEEGAQREVMEELGVMAEVGKLLFIQQFMSKRDFFEEELEFFFEVKDSPAFDSVNLAETTHGANELVRIEFVDPRKVKIMPAFLGELDVRQYIDEEMPTHISSELIR